MTPEETAALWRAWADLDARLRRLEQLQPAEAFTDPLAEYNAAAGVHLRAGEPK